MYIATDTIHLVMPILMIIFNYGAYCYPLYNQINIAKFAIIKTNDISTYIIFYFLLLGVD
jgi:hypothetical protein